MFFEPNQVDNKHENNILYEPKSSQELCERTESVIQYLSCVQWILLWNHVENDALIFNILFVFHLPSYISARNVFFSSFFGGNNFGCAQIFNEMEANQLVGKCIRKFQYFTIIMISTPSWNEMNTTLDWILHYNEIFLVKFGFSVHGYTSNYTIFLRQSSWLQLIRIELGRLLINQWKTANIKSQNPMNAAETAISKMFEQLKQYFWNWVALIIIHLHWQFIADCSASGFRYLRNYAEFYEIDFID